MIHVAAPDTSLLPPAFQRQVRPRAAHIHLRTDRDVPSPTSALFPSSCVRTSHQKTTHTHIPLFSLSSRFCNAPAVTPISRAAVRASYCARFLPSSMPCRIASSRIRSSTRTIASNISSAIKLSPLNSSFPSLSLSLSLSLYSLNKHTHTHIHTYTHSVHYLLLLSEM